MVSILLNFIENNLIELLLSVIDCKDILWGFEIYILILKIKKKSLSCVFAFYIDVTICFTYL